jgi:hypothetical protein
MLDVAPFNRRAPQEMPSTVSGAREAWFGRSAALGPASGGFLGAYAGCLSQGLRRFIDMASTKQQFVFTAIEQFEAVEMPKLFNNLELVFSCIDKPTETILLYMKECPNLWCIFR